MQREQPPIGAMFGLLAISGELRGGSAKKKKATCRAQKLVMQRRGKCGVSRQAQVPRRSFGMLAEGGALPRRVELPGPKSGAVASDCNR
jgi:hypothetical protein